MCALGQKQTSDCRLSMSALPPKADIDERDYHDRFVPKTNIGSVWEVRTQGQPKGCVDCHIKTI
jgi:hypothetical protein